MNTHALGASSKENTHYKEVGVVVILFFERADCEKFVLDGVYGSEVF